MGSWSLYAYVKMHTVKHVAKGETTMQDDISDKKEIRDQLELRLKTLGARVEELKGELRSGHSADSEEQATEREGDEVLESLEKSALLEIQHIQAALDRIDSGTYGICDACGEAIGEMRLKALPDATRCIGCADT